MAPKTAPRVEGHDLSCAETFANSGAGGGNRTRVISLGSWSNAIIRHPLRAADFVPEAGADEKF